MHTIVGIDLSKRSTGIAILRTVITETAIKNNRLTVTPILFERLPLRNPDAHTRFWHLSKDFILYSLDKIIWRGDFDPTKCSIAIEWPAWGNTASEITLYLTTNIIEWAFLSGFTLVGYTPGFVRKHTRLLLSQTQHVKNSGIIFTPKAKDQKVYVEQLASSLNEVTGWGISNQNDIQDAALTALAGATIQAPIFNEFSPRDNIDLSDKRSILKTVYWKTKSEDSITIGDLETVRVDAKKNNLFHPNCSTYYPNDFLKSKTEAIKRHVIQGDYDGAISLLSQLAPLRTPQWHKKVVTEMKQAFNDNEDYTLTTNLKGELGVVFQSR